MVDPYLGEIKLGGWNFAPFGWATCQGQLLPISQNTALFSILGTTYGGNGTSTFQLPDLQGRAICGLDPANNVMGESDGTETVTILISEYPSHTHTFSVFNGTGTAAKPTNVHYLANAGPLQIPSPPPPPAPNLYGAASGLTALNPAVLPAYAGGNQPHENRQPYLAMEYVIALQGIFPSRN